MSKVILAILIFLSTYWIYGKWSDKSMEVETLTYYLEKADRVLNAYKPEFNKYVGKQYNNTNNGEVITIRDMVYKNGCLWLRGDTPLGKVTFAPDYQYALWDNGTFHSTTVFDLRGDFQPGGAMYDTLTDKQKKTVNRE